MSPQLGCVPLIHSWTTLRPANELHTLETARFLVAAPHLVNRTASAITALPDTSPSTTLPVVPATNGCTPRVFHSPIPLPVLLTVYVLEPPEYNLFHDATLSRSGQET